MLADHTATIARAFAGGASPVADLVLVARGEQGRVWRLDTAAGPLAIKELIIRQTAAEAAADVAYQEAVLAAGTIPMPRPIRAATGDVLVEVGGAQVRAYEWRDLLPMTRAWIRPWSVRRSPPFTGYRSARPGPCTAGSPTPSERPGGPARIRGRGAFTMVIAQFGHFWESAIARYLAPPSAPRPDAPHFRSRASNMWGVSRKVGREQESGVWTIRPEMRRPVVAGRFPISWKKAAALSLSPLEESSDSEYSLVGYSPGKDRPLVTQQMRT